MSGKGEYVMVRVDADLKERAARIFESVGLTMSAAVRLFLDQTVIAGGIPFKVSVASEANRTLDGGDVSALLRREGELAGVLGTNVRYTDEERRRAVERYFELGDYMKVVRELGYPNGQQLKLWVSKDARFDPARHGRKRVSAADRQAAVEELRAGAPRAVVAARYGVSERTLARWLKAATG